MNREMQLLLRLLDEAYDEKAWHGPNLRGALRGLAAEQAMWRPGAERHNIWEIAIHAAYWKYAVRRRLLGEKRGSFSLKGSNWFARPEDCSEKAWKADLKLLDEEHRRLREAVAGFAPGRLYERAPGSKGFAVALIQGVTAHDLYHAGQIQLIKRLYAR
jgi:hypothetical protein